MKKIRIKIFDFIFWVIVSIGGYLFVIFDLWNNQLLISDKVWISMVGFIGIMAFLERQYKKVR